MRTLTAFLQANDGKLKMRLESYLTQLNPTHWSRQIFGLASEVKSVVSSRKVYRVGTKREKRGKYV